MGLLDKIKSSYLFTHLEVGKYTKRRRSMSCEFESQDREFYGKNYQNGEYLHCIEEHPSRRNSMAVTGSSKNRWSTVGSTSGAGSVPIRSSEAYNEHSSW